MYCTDCHLLYFIQLQDGHSAVCSGVHGVVECFLEMKVTHYIINCILVLPANS